MNIPFDENNMFRYTKSAADNHFTGDNTFDNLTVDHLHITGDISSQNILDLSNTITNLSINLSTDISNNLNLINDLSGKYYTLSGEVSTTITNLNDLSINLSTDISNNLTIINDLSINLSTDISNNLTIINDLSSTTLKNSGLQTLASKLILSGNPYIQTELELSGNHPQIVIGDTKITENRVSSTKVMVDLCSVSDSMSVPKITSDLVTFTGEISCNTINDLSINLTTDISNNLSIINDLSSNFTDLSNDY